MTTNFSKGDDFGGSINIEQLDLEIREDPNITTTLRGITLTGDEVTIDFESNLTPQEESQLNILILNHTPTTKVLYDNIVKANIDSYVIQTNRFRRMDAIPFEGSDEIGNIEKISALAFMDLGVSEFSIQIYDKTNQKIIAENTFTNTVEEIVDLIPISNIPKDRAIIEIKAKKSGGTGNKNAYLNSLVFYIKN